MAAFRTRCYNEIPYTEFLNDYELLNNTREVRETNDIGVLSPTPFNPATI